MRLTATPQHPTNFSQPAEGSPTASHSLDRRDAALLAFLVGCLAAMFWKVIFTPAMFFYRDVFKYSYPHARFIAEACRQATLPYWNPYMNYGEPVLANPNFLFFYPSTLLLILLPIDFAYTMHYVAHFALAGVGTYCLARYWGQSRAAALFAAFAFTFSGPLLSLGNLYNHAACAAWIPWALLLTERALESISLRPWFVLTLVFSLQFLAAEPFTLFATFGLSLGLALYRSGALRHPLAPPARRILLRFLLVGCWMIALSTVQLFPALDLLGNSMRGRGMTFNQNARWAFHPLSLLDIVLQDFFGPPFATPGVWVWVLNGGHDPYYPSVFVGFVPLFFALVGWARGRDQRRGFIAAAALTLLLLSFGRLTPLYALANLLLPPLQLVRFPVKLLVPIVLLTALLAGFGLDALRQSHETSSFRQRRILLPLQCLLAGAVLVWMIAWLEPQWIGVPTSQFLVHMNRLVTGNHGEDLSSGQITGARDFFLTILRLYLPGLAGLALGGMTWMLALERRRRWARRAVPLVAVLGLGQLALVNYRANPAVPKVFYAYRPPLLKHFEASNQPYRFYDLGRGWAPPIALLGAQDFVNFDFIPEAASFSSLALGGFRDKLLLEAGSMSEKVESGNSGDVDGSVSPFVFDFWEYVKYLTWDPVSTDYLLGRSNVRYLILPGRQPGAKRREVAQISNGSPQPSFLYENLCLTPRAYVAGRASWSTDTPAILARMASPDFDAQDEVILFGKPEARPPSQCSGPAGRVEIIDPQPNTVKLQAELFRPGYVVLLDRFNPNWCATLDGQEVPILHANEMFRAVHAEAGRHEVRFYYRQRGLKAGMLISLMALAGLGILYAIDPFRSKSSPLVERL